MVRRPVCRTSAESAGRIPIRKICCRESTAFLRQPSPCSIRRERGKPPSFLALGQHTLGESPLAVYHGRIGEVAKSLARVERQVERHAGGLFAKDKDFVGEQQRQAAYARLHAWLNDNLVPNEHAGSPDGHGGVQKALRLRNPRVITWAFIAWDK